MLKLVWNVDNVGQSNCTYTMYWTHGYYMGNPIGVLYDMYLDLVFGWDSHPCDGYSDLGFVITLSSNARRVPFEYPRIYLNKKGKACKARVNKWIINQT